MDTFEAFRQWGAQGGKKSARKLGKQGRSARTKRGWRTRKRNGKQPNPTS